ncbi:DUF4913 domain-containing protein [Vibrio cholerae]|nr:DUF4913 domain-containing protein [Vibrio cholerae]
MSPVLDPATGELIPDDVPDDASNVATNVVSDAAPEAASASLEAGSPVALSDTGTEGGDAPEGQAEAQAEPEAEEPENVYDDPYSFFTAELHPLYARVSHKEQEIEAGKQRFAWCPQWWRHIEAVTRINALWHAWEKSRLEDGAAMSTWLLDHADRQMDRLLSPDGPFAYCTAKDGHVSSAVPFLVDEYPNGLADVDTDHYTPDGTLK